MKPFINSDFMLRTEAARKLYHEHAEHMPIIDYHCHLSPKLIAEDHRFSSITELWLGGDHYKWRAERANGVNEQYITGDASDWEKFEKWAETVPYTFRNPLYHWTHLELKTTFGIDELLSPTSARRIYDTCNELLQRPDMTARGLMRKYGVECVVTTDDPIDTLEYHKAIKESGFEIKVLPAWRPDKAVNTVASDYLEYISKLSEASGVEIINYDSLIVALQRRQDYFADNGCVIADHGVSKFPSEYCDKKVAEKLFERRLNNESLTESEHAMLQTSLLLDLAKMNHGKNWAQQFHFGPLRNVNSRTFSTLGPDTGFDTMGDWSVAEALAKFLNALDSEGKLTRTIFYNINPADNDVVAAMCGNFQDGITPGKIQFGSGWWFNDQIMGMERQMNALSVHGLLSRFVGMLTDSRSFVSYPRHDYFRRVLCNLLGDDLEQGLLPTEEIVRIGQMVEDICYNNAKRYFFNA